MRVRMRIRVRVSEEVRLGNWVSISDRDSEMVRSTGKLK
jgi:hypothetical protein